MKNMYKIINKKKINILQNILLTSSCSWVEPFKVSELSESNSNMIVSIKKENFMRYIYIYFCMNVFIPRISSSSILMKRVLKTEKDFYFYLIVISIILQLLILKSKNNAVYLEPSFFIYECLNKPKTAFFNSNELLSMRVLSLLQRTYKEALWNKQ